VIIEMKDLFGKDTNDKIDGFIDMLLEDNEKSFDKEFIGMKLKFNKLLIDYFERYGKTISNDYFKLIPSSFDLLDYKVKIQILMECLEKNIKIEESKKYLMSLEGVHANDNLHCIVK
jgi:hypothetical protein